MRIAVFGTGGVGGYFGGLLARAEGDVVFIARGEHLRAIREHGLVVESAQGDFIIEPAQATHDPAKVGEVDLVILCVKTWQVNEAAEAMGPMIARHTMVLPLENGVEAPDQLAAALGREHVLGGLARVISFVAAPGRIRHVGGAGSLALGELDNRRSERAERLLETFTRAGIVAEIPDDIHIALWAKFLFIVPLSGVGAVTEAPFGVVRSLPQTREMIEQGMGEVLRVAQARGIRLGEEIVSRSMKFVDRQAEEGTTSMQRDIAAGRPSELDALVGAVVRLGREAGVATPLHAFFYASLLPKELRARGQLEFPS